MCKVAHEVFSRYSHWDGFDCIREQTGESVTTYCIPEGQLLSFIRDGDRFDCHTDSLMSVRMVTDSTGAVVARFDYSAWGGLLASSFDSVPGGMPYAWVGALGVRYDSTTGLHYMRQRWCDSSLGRFISRDPVWSNNSYSYCRNNPCLWVDPSGLQDNGQIVSEANRVAAGLAQQLGNGGALSREPALTGHNGVGHPYDVSPGRFGEALNSTTFQYNPSGTGGVTTPVLDENGKFTGRTITTLDDVAANAFRQGGDEELQNILIHEAFHTIWLEELFEAVQEEADKCNAENCERRLRKLIDQYWLKIHPHRWYDPIQRRFPTRYIPNAPRTNSPINWDINLPQTTITTIVNAYCRGKK